MIVFTSAAAGTDEGL